ncbi:MAG: IS256 family transposase [Dehalococcoidia bacterium]|nr:IS256 family transposase [Dehalococcoidia bacterium]
MKASGSVVSAGASYQVVSPKDSRQLSEFLAKEGQFLLPMLELITQAEIAVDEVIDVAGRATIEAILALSAQELAGPRHPGRQIDSDLRWHGRQKGMVCLAERKLRVDKPRLRRKAGGPGAEVNVPAYQAMQDDSRLGRRMLEILMHGVSTRSYRKVLPEMADTVGVAKSSVSREFIDASEEALRKLLDRRFDDKDILVIYLDGLIFGRHHVIAALGVDVDGHKHVLGLADGASENAAACKALLEDLVARGVKPGRRRLFVIDGSKALRAAIDAVYGKDNPVQRCRSHKVRNVLDQLPKDQRQTAKATMRAAYRLEAAQGKGRLEQLAQWYEKDWPQAAASLREGLDETFTINEIGLPGKLRRCLGTTNLIESPGSGVRLRTRRVCRWKDGTMVLRWAASAYLAGEKSFRRIMGFEQLWMLKAYLDENQEAATVAAKRKVG